MYCSERKKFDDASFILMVTLIIQIIIIIININVINNGNSPLTILLLPGR